MYRYVCSSDYFIQVVGQSSGTIPTKTFESGDNEKTEPETKSREGFPKSVGLYLFNSIRELREILWILGRFWRYLYALRYENDVQLPPYKGMTHT